MKIFKNNYNLKHQIRKIKLKETKASEETKQVTQRKNIMEGSAGFVGEEAAWTHYGCHQCSKVEIGACEQRHGEIGDGFLYFRPGSVGFAYLNLWFCMGWIENGFGV